MAVIIAPIAVVRTKSSQNQAGFREPKRCQVSAGAVSVARYLHIYASSSSVLNVA